MNQWLKAVYATALGSVLCVGLFGCGGGGSSPDRLELTPPVVETKGIEGGGIVRELSVVENTITVGSKQLDVMNPDLTVTIDSQPATLADLRVGQQISFLGVSSDDGVTVLVSSISQDDLIEGPIDEGSIDLAGNRLSVLGQTVVVGPLTLFSSNITPNDLSGLNAGDFVEVSGSRSSTGEIAASRIELEAPDDDFEVTGFITAIDTAAFTLVIGGLTVDYSAAELEGFTGEPAVGDLVEVEGRSLAGGVLNADEVELEATGSYEGGEGDLAAFEGEVTAVLSASEFRVAGQLVVINASTEFDRGAAEDLVLGAFVEVEGALSSSGELVAREIEFKNDERESRLELSGVVEDLDADSRTLVLLGITVRVIPGTRLEGENDAPLSFSELAIGQILEVAGYEDASDPGVLQAAKLEFEDDDDDESSVTGPASAIMEPTLSVFGVNVFTNANTEYGDDGDATQSGFFGALSPNDLVDAEGIWDGSTLTAAEIEKEDD